MNKIKLVCENNKYNLMREDGTYLLKDWCKYISEFDSGFAVVRFFNDTYNYIDETGKFLLEKPLARGYSFGDIGLKEGMKTPVTVVFEEGKGWNLIGTDGKYKSDSFFERICLYNGTGFPVKKMTGETGIITPEGNFLPDKPLN